MHPGAGLGEYRKSHPHQDMVWTDQPIASHYTNSTLPAHSTLIIYLILIPCISMVGNVIIVIFLVHNHLEKFLILSVIIFVD